MNWACCSALAGKESQPVVVEAPTNITRLGSWTTSPKGRGGDSMLAPPLVSGCRGFPGDDSGGGMAGLDRTGLDGACKWPPSSAAGNGRGGGTGNMPPPPAPVPHLLRYCHLSRRLRETKCGRRLLQKHTCNPRHSMRCPRHPAAAEEEPTRQDRRSVATSQNRQERQHLCPCEKFDRIQLAHGALHAPSTTFQGVKKTGPDDMDLCLAQPGRVPTATNLAFVSPGSSSHLRSRCPCSRRMGGATAVTGGMAGALDWGMTRRLSPPLCSRVERRMRGARAGRSLGSDFLSPYIYLEEARQRHPLARSGSNSRATPEGQGPGRKRGHSSLLHRCGRLRLCW